MTQSMMQIFALKVYPFGIPESYPSKIPTLIEARETQAVRPGFLPRSIKVRKAPGLKSGFIFGIALLLSHSVASLADPSSPSSHSSKHKASSESSLHSESAVPAVVD